MRMMRREKTDRVAWAKTITLLSLLTSIVWAEEVYAVFEVRAVQSSDLAFTASGAVEKLHVETGEVVKEGQLLAELVNDDVEASVEIARVAEKYAEKDYKRQQKAAEVTPQAQLDSYAYKYDNAGAQLKLQESYLKKTFLRAPFDGIITMKHIDTGDVVSGQMITAVYTIQSLSARRLIVRFDQKYHTRVKTGDPFSYTIDGDRESYQGTVYKVYPVIDTDRRKVIAEVKAENLPVGLFGDGTITVK